MVRLSFLLTLLQYRVSYVREKKLRHFQKCASINQILCVKSVAVAVRIETDKILDLQVGQLIHVECRAWFDGVIHDTKDMAGLVRFEVMLRG